MHVYKRTGSKFYHFRFTLDGIRYRKSSGLADRKAAITAAAKFRLDLVERKSGIRRQKAAPMFKDAVSVYLEWSRQHHAEHPNTTRRYETACKPLLAFFGRMRIDAITPEEIERYKSHRLNAGGKRGTGSGEVRETGRGLKPATVNRELACLKALFNHFIRQDIIDRNPVSRVRLLAENNEQMRVLSHDEEALYLAAASPLLHDVAVMMLETGMRPDEVFRIEAGNVNLTAGYVFNPRGKTNAARRKIPLTARAAETLRRRAGEASGRFLFPFDSDPDRPMTNANNAHARALKKSGLDYFRLYDLRHTFATRAAMAGTDLVTLAALLGHSKIQMVMRYAHPTADHQASAIRRLEEFNLARQMEKAGVTSEAIQ